uniref:SH3 domain-containing protein n=1 Tax=Parascaris univalens TaxID=6257 RepID=A0A915B5Z7_PARUN
MSNKTSFSNKQKQRKKSKRPFMTSSIPPAPPPPLNPSTFGKSNWSMKVEGTNGGTAEGSVEIPERQSVATLREQIANKLEVKAPNGTKAVVHNARERHRTSVTPHPTEVPPKSPVPFQKFVAGSSVSQVGNHHRMQASVQNETSDSTAQVAKPIVHEPAMLHVSSITPLPFSKSTPQRASLHSTPIYTPSSEKSFPNDFHNSYDGTNLQISTCNGGIFHEGKYTTKTVRDDGITSVANSLSFLSNSDAKNEGSDSAIDLTPPATKTTSESTKCTNDYTSDYMLASPSSTSVQSPQPEMPPFSTPFDPESERSAQALASPASRSGAAADSGDVRPLLDASAMRDDSSKRCASSQRLDMNIQQQSDTSYWYKHMFKKMHRIEQGDQSILKYRARDFASPTPSYISGRAWTPTPRSESRPGSRLEYECAPRRSKSVGRYVDSSLHNDEDIVERWREERARLSTRSPISSQRNLNSTQSSAAVHTNENGSTSRDFLERKKSVKEEMINRQRVEKLTEELEQQRSRRHGYVPSASPALQKNFDRFDGLLNDFGHDSGRSVTPTRITPALIATCTALYSFRAQSARELSFNRGDVIRVHRVVDLNWLEGERNGQIGIFPSSYVQMDEGLPEERMKLIALFPFFARNRNELSLKKGEIVRYRRSIDTNWLEGVNNRGEIGIFPKTYVQEIRDSSSKLTTDFDIDSSTPDRPKTPKIFTSMPREESPLPSKKTSHGDEVQAWQKKHSNEGLSGPAQIIPRNAETYRALYAYKPQNVDELELRENDIVFVVEKCDDGWYIGTSLRSGQFGTFPGNYVERH